MMVLDMNEGTLLECNSATTSPAQEITEDRAMTVTAPAVQLQEIEFTPSVQQAVAPALLQLDIETFFE